MSIGATISANDKLTAGFNLGGAYLSTLVSDGMNYSECFVLLLIAVELPLASHLVEN